MSADVQHKGPVTDAQLAAAAEATRVDGGRAVVVPHDAAQAYNDYLREHARELALLYRIRREYMGDAPLR